jgi:hypothetical protein
LVEGYGQNNGPAKGDIEFDLLVAEPQVMMSMLLDGPIFVERFFGPKTHSSDED